MRGIMVFSVRSERFDQSEFLDVPRDGCLCYRKSALTQKIEQFVLRINRTRADKFQYLCVTSCFHAYPLDFNFWLNISVKFFSGNWINRATLFARLIHTSAFPSKDAARSPSMFSAARSLPLLNRQQIRSSTSGGNRIERSFRECGQIGVIRIVAIPGATTGPPAESE